MLGESWRVGGMASVEPAVRIAGAPGEYADRVNGVYEPLCGLYNGKTLYRRADGAS